jgi:hypothetical protein
VLILKNMVDVLICRNLEARVFIRRRVVPNSFMVRPNILKVEMVFVITWVELPTCEHPCLHDRNEHFFISKLDREINAPSFSRLGATGPA